jgi:hypothetical protein
MQSSSRHLGSKPVLRVLGSTLRQSQMMTTTTTTTTTLLLVVVVVVNL